MKTLSLAAIAVLVMFAASSCNQSTNPPANSNVFPSPSGKAPTQTTTDFSTTVLDTCCNDTISISGNLHWLTYSDPNGNGFRIHANTSQLTGTGTSGNTYHGSITLNEISQDNSNGANVLVAHESAVMTAAGGCQFTLNITEVLVVDANGNVRVDRYEYSTTCF